MSEELYFVDLCFEKYYGPYSNKKDLIKDMDLVKQISDLMLEIGTNVFESDEKEIKEEFYIFTKGDIEEYKKSLKKLMEEQ